MTNVEVIRPFVEQAVRGFLGVDELNVMSDGTIPIRAGSAAVNVRLYQPNKDQRPLLQVFSPLLLGVERSPELLDKLNEMNAGFAFARAFWESSQVIIAMELLAEEIDAAQVAHACQLVTFAADYWDNELQRGFGGDLSALQTQDTASAPDSVGDQTADDGGGGYL